MKRRMGRTLLAALLLGASGCALFQIILLPFQLLFHLLGAGASAVGLADVPPTADPPIVAQTAPGEWRVTGLRADVPCKIVCTNEGSPPRVYSWPADFRDKGEDVFVRFDGTR